MVDNEGNGEYIGGVSPSDHKEDNGGDVPMCLGGRLGPLPLEEEYIEAMGLWKIREYARRWQAKVVEYITTCPIFELCNGKRGFRGKIRA